MKILVCDNVICVGEDNRPFQYKVKSRISSFNTAAFLFAGKHSSEKLSERFHGMYVFSINIQSINILYISRLKVGQNSNSISLN